jgi:hypothetical protein
MNEKTWLKCTDPRQMLKHLGAVPSDRALRLFSCACCRRAWGFARDKRLEPLLLLFEGLADGTVPNRRREPARERCYTITQADVGHSQHCLAWEMWGGMRKTFVRNDNDLGESAAAAFGYAAGNGSDFHRAKAAERAEQARLVREIFGNPFRPITFDPAWRTDTVLTLARQMYESRDFSATPILADALQDTGCNDPELLNHLRAQNEAHFRGCWVVDRVLDRQ